MIAQPIRLLVATWFAAWGCLLTSPAAAQTLLLNDGLENTIDRVSPDVEVRDGPGPGLDPTTLHVLSGAQIAEQGDLSVSVFETSLLDMSGGETAGGVDIADNSEAHVAGGTIAGEVLVEGSARFELSGDGNLASDVAVEGAARFEMTGGTVEGELAFADTASGNFLGGTLEDTLVAEDNAEIRVMLLEADDNVEAADNAFIEILGGEFAGSVEAADASVIQIAGGTFASVFSGGEELLATGGGTIHILGGEFGTAGEADDEGGIIASLGSVANISGITIAGLAEGTAPTATMSAVLNGELNLVGGVFGDVALEAANNGTLNVANISAENVSVHTLGGGTVNIAGGEAESLEVFSEISSILNLTGGSFDKIDATLESESVLTVFGHSFTFLGTPVEMLADPDAYVEETGELRAIAGELAGILADGTPFSMTFSRQFVPVPGARVFLVQIPEPGSSMVTSLAGGLTAGLRWRRRRTLPSPFSRS